jgi:hypothetical protein
MASSEPRSPIPGPGPDDSKPLPDRLERGEIVYFASCPFALPTGSDLQFLLDQRVGGSSARHIVFEPLSTEVHHSACTDRAGLARLADILAAHRRQATAWLSPILPSYAPAWQMGSITLRPEEEATRRLRFSQREDLLHLDPFPDGASRGRRLLRLFANLNPSEPRVWATSDGLARLLERFGDDIGKPFQEHSSWAWQVRQGVLGFLDSRQRGRSASDDFLLRLEAYLKANDRFQERGPKRFWQFAPGSAWLVMTDGLSHAVLRGRHALEMSIFIDPATLACPELAPAQVIERYGAQTGIRRAA